MDEARIEAADAVSLTVIFTTRLCFRDEAVFAAPQFDGQAGHHAVRVEFDVERFAPELQAGQGLAVGAGATLANDHRVAPQQESGVVGVGDHEPRAGRAHQHRPARPPHP